MSIRAAYGVWPKYNQRLTELVAAMTGEQLALQPSPERWPLWASVGHLACQRVFWLCDVAGEPGADQTPFPDAGNNCPGDDDLDHVLGPPELASALGATFAIVDRCLDSWTIEMLAEEVRPPLWDEASPAPTRGWALQRVFSHDVYHCAEVNESLGCAGLPQVDLWG